MGAVFRREIGVALPHTSVVCVDRFPFCGELRLPVLGVKDESTDCQTGDALCWFEGEETQKPDDQCQTEPFRAGKENSSGKKWRSPADNSERRDRAEQDAQWHRECSFAPPAGEQQTQG